jgi:HD-GYP domain-containing protein (c-di-GMP phosphodiesterase class II)
VRVNFNSILYAASFGLDCVEQEVLGVTTNHGKRVAYVAFKLAQARGITGERLIDLVACAILHDNALAETVRTELSDLKPGEHAEDALNKHCELGEKNVREFPFQTDMHNIILYHHENIDGTGPLGKKGDEIPPLAMYIHMADILDLNCQLGHAYPHKTEKVEKFLAAARSTRFPASLEDLFHDIFTCNDFTELLDENIDSSLAQTVPDRIINYSMPELRHMAAFFARIIDNKSSFTCRHSMDIAAKAEQMGKFYGNDQMTVDKLYLAGAFHDIGKLAIPNTILEKPGKLEPAEFKKMQEHALYSYKILSKIHGFEDICSWACTHHEKLDGSGYPFRINGDKLNHNQRLLCCIDIYQALTEARPYKTPFSHGTAIKMMRSMAAAGKIDRQITEDIDRVFAPAVAAGA